MFRTTTKLRNWFSFGVNRNPLLFSAAAVFLSTLLYVCVWSYVNVTKPDPLSIFTLECVLVVNLIFFVFMCYKHSLINWSVSESGVARDNWTTDQNGNGIAEGISEAGEPCIYFILNGYLEFYKKEDIEVSAPIKTFLSHTYRNILVTNPNGTNKSIKIKCDNDLLNSALKKIMNQNASEEETTELSKQNSGPSLDDKSSKSYSHNNPDTDATTSERPEGSCSSTSQRELPERSNEMKPSGTKQEPENSQAQSCCSNPSAFNGPEKERTSRSDRPDTSTDETNDYKSKPTKNDNNHTDREQTNPDSFDPSKQFPNAELDKLGNLVFTLLLDKGAEEVKINPETKRSNRNDNRFFVMVLKDVIRELSSKYDITLSNYIFAKILKETFYSDFKKLDSIERYVDRAKYELKSNKQKVTDS
jgi:hypothetical protein